MFSAALAMPVCVNEPAVVMQRCAFKRLRALQGAMNNKSAAGWTFFGFGEKVAAG
jgi:hypothetical protein